MNYNSIIGPLSPSSGASPLMDTFPSSRFPIEAISHNDSLSPLESYDALPSIRLQVPQSQSQSQSYSQPQLQSHTLPVQSPLTPSQQPQSQRLPSMDTGSTSATTQIPSKEKRRWSLTGRLFEKRKSHPASSNIPNTQTQTSGITNASARDIEKNASSPSNIPGNRRSSLVDIPKALLSSFRRASIVSPAENKEKLNKSLDGWNPSNSSIERISNSDFERGEDSDIVLAPITTTIMTINGPSRSTLIPPKEITSDDDSDTASFDSSKVILTKIPAAQRIPSSIEESSLFSSSVVEPLNQETPDSISASPLITPSIVESIELPSPLLKDEDIHPLAPMDTNEDITILHHMDHRARLGALSPVPGPHPHQQLHQQNLQMQQHELSPPLLSSDALVTSQDADLNSPRSSKPPSAIDMDATIFQGAAFPSQFTPGTQSNRGGQRSNGLLVDPYVDDVSYTEIHRHLSHQHHDPFAISGHVAGGYDTDSPEPDLSTVQLSTVSSRSSDDSDESMLDLSDSDSEPHLYSNGDMAMHRIRQPGEHVDYPVGSPRSSTGSSSDGYRRKSITFIDEVEIIPVHRKSEYNRQSDRNATFRVLTPGLKAVIREELNNYKMREMAVHVRSMGNTAFH
ncbi:hypothetical protein BGZ46_008346 [Entomortierella lignicola]|nr:hypothetical protein BGZ46_008346 [Entomortierella lignicola]